MTKFIERRNRRHPITKKIVVFYHANCTDGFSAAWAAWKKFGVKAQYVATFHEDPLPPGLKNKEIFTLDMTFPEAITKKLIRTNKRVTAIDHHITSRKTTMLTYKYSYALHHSGATLAWKYFHPGKPVPSLLLSVQDMDLWKFKIKGTTELFAYLELHDFDFRKWSAIAKTFEDLQKRKKILKTGHLIQLYINRLLERQVNNSAHKVSLGGKTVLAANATGAFRSELGNLLAKASPSGMGLVWWENNDGLIAASLRSVGKADVGKLAERFGGGGHKHSASFRVRSLKDIPWKSIKK